jgi:hypothetical protein
VAGALVWRGTPAGFAGPLIPAGVVSRSDAFARVPVPTW